MEKTSKNRGLPLKAADVFVIVAIVLILTAVIGQSVAVYLQNRAARVDEIVIRFTAPSVEKTDAEKISSGQNAEGTALPVLIGQKKIGTLQGEVTLTTPSGSGASHLTFLEATLVCRGSVKGGTVSVYGVGEVKSGDVLTLRIEGVLLTASVISVEKTP